MNPADNGRAGRPRVSVVISTFNRAESAARLLEQLAGQTMAPDRFEVVVVDDGSATPVAGRLVALTLPYRLVLVTQENGGPAAARHAGVLRTSGDLIVIVDDDMRVAPDFLERHYAAHADGLPRVVLGRLRSDPGAPLQLFDRVNLHLLDKLAARVSAGGRLSGLDLYTGNVSMRRADYFDAGGLDTTFRLSEDAELGLRLQQRGATFMLSDGASTVHASDHTSVAAWMRRGVAYGAADSRVAAKHPGESAADPWRFLFLVNPVSRPFLLASALAPGVMRAVAWTAMGLALGLDRIGAERAAIAGGTFVYGMQYFAGIRAAAGTRTAALVGLRRYLNNVSARDVGLIGRCAKFVADLRADQEAMRSASEKYWDTPPRRQSLLADAIQRIGFQMLVAYRYMRLLRSLHLGLIAKIVSRLIRYVYGAELHWDADLAPGVIIVHGTGLVISHAAVVGRGCVLFQHVTLGASIHPDTRATGAPTLEPDVHIGPGAILLGPITIGRGTKVMANAVVMRSVPADSIVETPAPLVRPRRPGTDSVATVHQSATPVGHT